MIFWAQCVAQADEVEPTLKAFTIRAKLPDLKHQSKSGPLMGIPVGVKDIIATKEFVTTNGSPIYKDFTPSVDATIVQKIRSLLAASFSGKRSLLSLPGDIQALRQIRGIAHTPQEALPAALLQRLLVAQCLQHWDRRLLAQSLDLPHFAGLWATRPALAPFLEKERTQSLIPQDHIGFFTRSVPDARYAFNLLRNTDLNEKDAIVIDELIPKSINETLGNAQLRIGVLKTPFDELLSQEQIETVKSAAHSLEKSGANVRELTLPQTYWDGIEALAVLMSCEAAVVHEKHLEKFPSLLSADMKELIDRGNSCPVGDYIKAKIYRQNYASQQLIIFIILMRYWQRLQQAKLPKVLISPAIQSFALCGLLQGLQLLRCQLENQLTDFRWEFSSLETTGMMKSY